MRISDWSSDVCSSDLLVDGPVGEVGDAGRLEGGCNHFVVAGVPACQWPLVRVAAASDEVGDGDPVRRDRALGEEPEGPRDLPGRPGVHALAVEDHGDRKSAVAGKSVSVSCSPGGRRDITKK